MMLMTTFFGVQAYNQLKIVINNPHSWFGFPMILAALGTGALGWYTN